MTKTILNTQNPEIKRNYIIEILEQLTVDYQNTKQERKEVAALDPNFEEEFTVLEEIELLTVDIRGYASQIKTRGWIENEQQAINQLKSMQLFDVPAIAQFYLTTGREYKRIKAYMQMLDYLRLLILEYLQPNQHSQPESV
jgi:hypothetical protein